MIMTLIFSGCVAVNPYVGAPEKIERTGELIHAEDSGFSFLWLNAPKLDAVSRFKCNGEVRDIRVSSSIRMLFIGLLYKQEAWGYCSSKFVRKEAVRPAKEKINRDPISFACESNKECLELCKSKGYLRYSFFAKKCLCN